MKKREKEYLSKYGSVSKDLSERLEYLKDKLKLKEKDMIKIREFIPKLLLRKWVPVDFVFFMIPKATPRPRSNSHTKIFYVKSAKDNSELFDQFLDVCSDMDFTIATPTRICCDIYMPTPDNMTRHEKLLAELCLLNHISKPDWDNLAKTYCDMIQGRFLVDDSVIIDGRVRKFYSIKPRIEVHLEFMEKFDCNYNMKKVLSWGSTQELKHKIYANDSIVK